MATGTNFSFVKMISETEIVYAPRVLKCNGKTYVNPKEVVYNSCGYYKIVYTSYPNSEIDYTVHYELVENQIVQSWILVE